MEPIRLWLDDLRDPAEHRPGEDWLWVKTVAEAIAVLESQPVSHLGIDNDLGEGVPEGYTLANWMGREAVWPSEEILVNTDNAARLTSICNGIIHDSRGRFRRVGRRLVAVD